MLDVSRCHEAALSELYIEVSDQSLCSGCLVSSSLGLVQFCPQTTRERPTDRDWALGEDSKLSQCSGQDYLRGFLKNFSDELEDEAREVEAGT